MACNCGGGRCQCIVEAGECLSVEGRGSTQDPFIISTVISPLEGNILECTRDGLYVPEQAVTHLEVEDTTTVDMTLSGDGTGLSPYLLKSDVNVDPRPDNLISVTPDGLLAVACVDGCLSLDADGCVVLNVSEDDCNAIQCRPDGLFAFEHFASQGFTPPAGQIAAGQVLGTDQFACSPMTEHVVTNPSNCLPLALHLQFGLTVQAEIGPGAQPNYEYNRIIDGVPGGPIVIRTAAPNNGTAPYGWSDDMERDFFNITIPPGGTVSFSAQVCVRNVGTGTITTLGGGASIRHWGGTS